MKADSFDPNSPRDCWKALQRHLAGTTLERLVLDQHPMRVLQVLFPEGGDDPVTISPGRLAKRSGLTLHKLQAAIRELIGNGLLIERWNMNGTAMYVLPVAYCPPGQR
jgi:hypothetical protein